MTDDRLPTSFWLEAHFASFTAQALPYIVIQKGAPVSGTVMVKIYAPGQGCKLLQQQRDLDGEMGWMLLKEGADRLAESEIDAYIARAIDRDPDLWVIEVENKDLSNPFEGKIF